MGVSAFVGVVLDPFVFFPLVSDLEGDDVVTDGFTMKKEVMRA